MVADMPAALYGNRNPREPVAVPKILCRRLDRAEYAARGVCCRVDRVIQKASNVTSLRAYNLHVRGTCSNILRGDVTSSKRFNETPVSAENCFAVQEITVTNDDGLSASQWQRRQSVFVSHASR